MSPGGCCWGPVVYGSGENGKTGSEAVPVGSSARCLQVSYLSPLRGAGAKAGGEDKCWYPFSVADVLPSLRSSLSPSSLPPEVCRSWTGSGAEQGP